MSVHKNDKNILVVNAQVIDGAGNQPRIESVFIQADKIAATGTEADQLASNVINNIETIDAQGCTLMPGLIDCHCHISFDEPSNNDELFFHRREGLATLVAGVNAQKVLRAGVTSFFDADCIFDVGVDLRDAIEGGVIEGPRMATGGNALITTVGGAAGSLLPNEGRMGYAVIVQTKDEIIKEVRRQIKLGVDWIKVHVSGLPIRRATAPGEIQAWTVEELRLICDTAHMMGIPVVGHCRDASTTRDAANAGMDMILHATFMDEEALEAVVEAGTTLVPTLTFQANLADYGEKVGADPNLQKIFQAEIESSSVMLRRAYDAGVPFATGSESGFSLTPYGEWHHRELEIFVKNMGLTPLQAIQCGTQGGATAFGLEGKLGCIAKGYLADVLIVEGDPLQDITLLGEKDKFKHLFKSGKPVNLETPLPDSWNITGWQVSPFSNRVLTQAVAGDK